MRKQYHTRTVGTQRHTWDVHRLVRLSKGLPVLTVLTSRIAEVDELWWYQTDTDIPTPRSIADHMQLVARTDLRWPIVLCADGRLMDGMHRVIKAMIERRTDLPAVRFDTTPTPDFVDVDVDTLPYPDEYV